MAFPIADEGEGDNQLGTSEIKTGVPKTFSSDGGGVKMPQVVSFDDVSNIDQDSVTSEENLPSLNEWLLLECHFGLPLFDDELNQEVSKSVVKHNLFSQEK